MNKILMTLTVIAFNFSAVSCQNQTNSASVDATEQTSQVIERVDNAKFTSLLEANKDAQIIDVRTPEEFAGGTINDAVNINFFDKDFKEQLSKLDKSKPVFMFCKSGGRSGKAIKTFKELGFETVYELGTGYSGWPNK